MANATNSGRMAACNPNSPSIDTAIAADLWQDHPGLVAHPLVSPTVQVPILSAVDATVGASIGAIIAAPPGHPDPGGASFALFAAGVRDPRPAGFVDASTLVDRAVSSVRPHGAS